MFIVCRKDLGLVKHKKIDHEEKYRLTNFKAKNRNGKVTANDHRALLLVLDLSIPIAKPERISDFNYKNVQ